MTRRERGLPVPEALVLDESVQLTLGELARACGLEVEAVMEMVEVGLLEPRGRGPLRWRFPASSVARARRAARLQADLELNLAGAALVLELLDEIRALRARVRALEQALEPCVPPTPPRRGRRG
ncbi:MAG TPA: MerR family transcriptional regulator [Chromatiales bacterium]|nr:MerR family transcriptional regulator [Chromatiales bacterium]